MSLWRVELSPSARRGMHGLDEAPLRAAVEMIEDLEEGPELPGAIKMRGYPNTWRARFFHDRYRMVYDVLPRQHIIVRRIAPRPIAYKGMRS